MILRAVRSLLVEIRGIQIELTVVRRMLGENAKVSGCIESCKEVLEGFRGIRRVENCKEFVSRMARYPIELIVVRRMLGEMIGI